MLFSSLVKAGGLVLIALSIGVLSTAGGQAQSTPTTRYKPHCPDVKAIYIPLSDTVRGQLVLDSINRLLVGTWQLIQTGDGGWSLPRTPSKRMDMTIDPQGHATIPQEHQPVIPCHLTATLALGYTRCVLDEPGRAYFNFKPSGFKYKTPTKSDDPKVPLKAERIYSIGLRVCEENLVLSGSASTGPTYIFRRLTPIIQPRN